jgi:hypothetical protein
MVGSFRKLVRDRITMPPLPAQTERRGLAGPVRDLLGGVNSPAAF